MIVNNLPLEKIEKRKEELEIAIVESNKLVVDTQNKINALSGALQQCDLFIAEIETFEGERIMGLKTENEDILVRSYKISEVKDKLKNGEILNGLTLIALQWFFLNINN